MIIELVLTPRQIQAVDELERHWRGREATLRWDDSDETCEQLLNWLRGQGHITEAHLAAATRSAPMNGRSVQFGLNVDPNVGGLPIAERIATIADVNGLELIGIQDHPYNQTGSVLP